VVEEEQVEPEADDAEMIQQLREELKSLTVSDHLLFMMHSLSALAVDRMGLTEEAGGHRDLEEARLAIDAFKALADLVGTTRPPEEMAVHRGALSQLQMSYVGVLGGGGLGEESPDDAPGGSPEMPDDAPDDSPDDAPDDSPDDSQGRED
jgi:hypothetical protein